MTTPFYSPDKSLLLIVDVQERLWPYISNKEQVRDRCQLMMKGAQALRVPVVVSEQYPKGLGASLSSIKACQPPEALRFEKTSFGCLGDEGLARHLAHSGRRQLVICGIETHVCVMQTALEALAQGYRCAIVADAVGSREESNRLLALDRLRSSGADIVSSEVILFEWMGDSKHPAFKTISGLVK